MVSPEQKWPARSGPSAAGGEPLPENPWRMSARPNRAGRMLAAALLGSLLVPASASFGDTGAFRPPVSVGPPGVSSLVTDGTQLYAAGATGERVWLARSPDGGSSWEPARDVYSAPDGHIADVRAAAYGAGFALAIVSGPYDDGYGGATSGQLVVAVSADNGVTFATPSLVEPVMGIDSSWDWDIAWGASGLSVGWTRFDGNLTRAFLVRSPDGVAFGSARTVASGETLQSLQLASGAVLHLMIRTLDQTLVMTSADGGESFGAPESLAGYGYRDYADVDPVDGSLYVLLTTSSCATGGPTDVTTLHRRTPDGWRSTMLA